MRRIHCALPMQNCPTFFNQNHKRGGSPSALVVKKPTCSGEISRRLAVIQTFQPFSKYGCGDGRRAATNAGAYTDNIGFMIPCLSHFLPHRIISSTSRIASWQAIR